jgi:exopolysaccharide biosynthesis polyprenyl glycosylphosphotransferase
MEWFLTMPRLFSQPHQKYRFLLLLGDLLIIFANLCLVLIFTAYKKGATLLDISEIVVIYLISSAIMTLIFYILDLYDLSNPKNIEIVFLSIFLGIGIITILFIVVSYFIISLRVGKINLILFSLLNTILIFVWHKYFLKLIKINPQRLLFIGSEAIFDDISKIIHSEYSQYYIIVGNWHRHSHSLPDLVNYIKNNDIALIVYSVHSNVVKQISNDLISFKFSHKNIIDAYNFYQRLTSKYPVYFIDDFWLLINAQKEIMFPTVASALKRTFDLLFVLISLPLALPIVLIAALAIKLDSKGPVFFIQERLGQNEVPFRLIKMRTMVHHAERATGPRWSIEDDERVTRVGRILRKSRVDEFPQLFNILKGEMAVVGPRPIRKYFTDKLAEEIPFYKLRLLAKPGLTGWAQVNYGHAHTSEGHSQMVQYDLFYLVHQSMGLDLLILLKTIKVMVWGKGT